MAKRYNAFFHLFSNKRNKTRGLGKTFKYFSREFSPKFPLATNSKYFWQIIGLQIVPLETTSQHSHPSIRWFIFMVFFSPFYLPASFPHPFLVAFCLDHLYLCHSPIYLIVLYLTALDIVPVLIVFPSIWLPLWEIPHVLLNLSVDNLIILQVRNLP